MNEDSDMLLRQFLSESSQQIADEGFTGRVMRRLPRRTNWFVRLWTWACVTLFAVLFTVLNGWQLLAVHVEVLLRTTAASTPDLNLPMLAAVVFGLLLVGVSELALNER